MRDDLSELMQRIHALPDRKLVSLLEQDRDQYTPEAISIAEEEAEARGGLLHLKQETAPAVSQKQRRKRGKEGRQFIEDLFSRLIGRAPSEKYPSLSYVSIALRLISFILAALAVILSVASLNQLVAGSEEFWLVTLMGSLQVGLAFLLFYGGSELINVVLDIEKNTREDRSRQREKPQSSKESDK